MASNYKDSVIHWRKKVERTSDDYTILSVIHKLSKVPITIELLQDTGIGKVIRNLAKHEGKVGVKASAVLHSWRKILASSQNSSDNSSKTSHSKHDSTKKESSYKDSVKRENSSKDRVAITPCNEPSTQVYESKKDHKKKKLIESKHEQKSSSKDKDSPKKTVKKHEETSMLSSDQDRKKCESSKVIHSESHTMNSDVMDEWIQDSPNKYNYEHCTNNMNKDEGYINGKRKLSKKDTASDGSHESKKRKTEISELSVNLNNPTVTTKQTDKNSSKKKDKNKKSHSSNSECSDKSSQKSHAHNNLNKSSNVQKEKSEKTKKLHHAGKNRYSELKKTLKMQTTDAFTSSEVRFEDCLSFNDIVPVKKKKSSKATSEKKGKCFSDKKKYETEHSKPKHEEKLNSKPHKIEEKVNVVQNFPPEPSHTLLPKDREIDIASTLPQPQINYRPLPQRTFDCFPSKRKVLSNEDAIKFTSSKREKTAVYSGRRNIFFTEVPSLFESCTRILIENIDAIEYLGGVPYYLLKPVLERCTPQQLDTIEQFNPDLLDDSQELWEVHCKRDFRTQKPDENETWRDLYWRAFEERERKLKTLTENISASMSKSQLAGRSVKLTYVDTFAKPPRDVARKQMKNGTGLPVNHTVKVGPPSKASPRPTAPAINSAASSTPKVDLNPKKPKVAPLMAKTLKSMRQCFRR